MAAYSLGVTAGTFNLVDVNSVSHSVDALFAVIENQSVSVYLANGFYLIPPLFFDGIINDDTGLPFVSFPALNTFVRNSFTNIYDHYPSALSSFADYYVNGGGIYGTTNTGGGLISFLYSGQYHNPYGTTGTWVYPSTPYNAAGAVFQAGSFEFY